MVAFYVTLKSSKHLKLLSTEIKESIIESSYEAVKNRKRIIEQSIKVNYNMMFKDDYKNFLIPKFLPEEGIHKPLCLTTSSIKCET